MSSRKEQLPRGITRDRNGFRVFVRINLGGTKTELRTKRFPEGTAISAMVAWQEAQREDARPKAERGTLAADVAKYLGQVRAMPSLSYRTRDLDAWIEVFGDLARAEITEDMIREQLQTWRKEGPVTVYIPRTKERRIKRDEDGKPIGLSASACNHRRSALLHLWTVLDGKKKPNPVREVKQFKEPAPAPRARNLDELLAAIETLRNPKQRARALVMAWTGIRGNCELSKMTPEHLDLDHAICHVPNGKGVSGSRVVPLNERGIAAWKFFAEVDAWGGYDKDALRKSIALACKKRGMSGVRAYDLRHSIATAYLKGGADLADVQVLLGHTTGRMTRRYAPFTPEKLREVGKLLGGGGSPSGSTPAPSVTA